MTTVLAFANQSGGCGKTTAATGMAAVIGELLEAGPTDERCLVIDLDLQGDGSHVLGITAADQTCGECGDMFPEHDPRGCPRGGDHVAIANMADVLAGIATMDEVIIPTQWPRVDLAPASLRLAAAEKNLSPLQDGQLRLRNAMIDLIASGRYKVILIDSPASLGVVAVNIFAVSRYVLACIKPGAKELRGLVGLEATIGQVNREINAQFAQICELGAIVVTDAPTARSGGAVYAEAMDYATDEYKGLVLPIIPRDVRVPESYSHQIPTPLYDGGKGKAAKALRTAVGLLIEMGVLPPMGPPPKAKRAPKKPAEVIPAESPASTTIS